MVLARILSKYLIPLGIGATIASTIPHTASANELTPEKTDSPKTEEKRHERRLIFSDLELQGPQHLVKNNHVGEIEFNLQNRLSAGWHKYHGTSDAHFRVDANLFDVELIVKDNAFIGYVQGQFTDPQRVRSSASSVVLGAGYRIFNDDRLRVDIAGMLNQRNGTYFGYRARVTGNELVYTYSAEFRQSGVGYGISGEGKYHIKDQTFIEGFTQWFNDTFKIGAGVGYAFFMNYATARMSIGPFYHTHDGGTFGFWGSVSATTPGSYEVQPRAENKKQQPEKGTEKRTTVATLEQRTTTTDATVVSYTPSSYTPPTLVGTDEYVKCIENECRLEPETETCLRTAAEIAEQKGYGLIVTSTHRTPAFQKELYDHYGTRACGPSTLECPHVKGTAVDITFEEFDYVEGKAVSEQMGCMGADCKGDVRYNPRNPGHRTLREIMEKAGFKGNDAEWWHFEKR